MESLAANHRMRGIANIWICMVGVDQHLLMVALDAIEPWLIKQLEHLPNPRPSVDDIAHSDQPVDRLIKAEPAGLAANPGF